MNIVVPALTVCTIVDTEIHMTFYLCPADYSNKMYVALAVSRNFECWESVADNIVIFKNFV